MNVVGPVDTPTCLQQQTNRKTEPNYTKLQWHKSVLCSTQAVHSFQIVFFLTLYTNKCFGNNSVTVLFKAILNLDLLGMHFQEGYICGSATWRVQSWRLAKLSYEYVFFNGPMLVMMDFGPAVVLYNTPCAVCVRGLQAGE